MIKTIIRRLIIMIPQLLLISLAVFFLAYLMPGDFVSGMIGQEFTLTQIEQMRDQLGLNDPWYIQYVRWLGNLARGDLGMSFAHQRPVVDVLGDRIVNTLRLSLTSVVLLLAISIPLGILAGRFYRGAVDKAILVYGFIGMALPAIVQGLVLIWVFGIRLDVLPARGSVDVFMVGTGWGEFWSRMQHLILPSIALSTFSGVGMIYMLRSQIVEGRSSDYATTARSKGVPENIIFRRHIMRNSLIPLAGDIGFIFVGLFAGTVFIERIFSYPGMGLLFLESIALRDMGVVSALVVIYAALSVIGVLIGDIALTVADPRIRIK